MHSITRSFAVACLLSLGPLCAAAQDYQPVYRGETYAFMTGPTGNGDPEVIRVDSVAAMGNDSVFFFRALYAPSDSAGEESYCPSVLNTEYAYDLGKDNWFGQYMLKQGGGAYVFVGDSAGDTFLLQTRVPVNTTWDFSLAHGVTATLVARNYQAIPNLGVSDSVLVIDISNTTQDILLSQHHGFVEAYNFVHVWDNPPYLPIRGVLRGIPERGLGTYVSTFAKVFDFAVGDQFDYIASSFYTTSYASHWVLAKTVNPKGDTLRYTLQRRRASIVHVPFQDTTYYGYDTYTQVFALQDYAYLDEASQGYSWNWYNASLIVPPPANPRFPGTQEIKVDLDYVHDPCSNRLNGSNWHDAWYQLYAIGLGLVYDYDYTDNIYTTRMACYQKSTGSGGTCIDWNDIVAGQADRAEFSVGFHVAPNPAQDHVDVVLEGNDLPNGQVELLNLQGVVVKASPLAGVVRIVTDDLGAGMYLVRVSGDGRAAGTQKVIVAR